MQAPEAGDQAPGSLGTTAAAGVEIWIETEVARSIKIKAGAEAKAAVGRSKSSGSVAAVKGARSGTKKGGSRAGVVAASAVGSSREKAGGGMQLAGREQLLRGEALAASPTSSSSSTSRTTTTAKARGLAVKGSGGDSGQFGALFSVLAKQAPYSQLAVLPFKWVIMCC